MSADIKTILYKLSDLGYIRLNREMGQWFSIYCPFHNDGNEKKPSCGVALYPEVRAGVRHEAGVRPMVHGSSAHLICY